MPLIAPTIFDDSLPAIPALPIEIATLSPTIVDGSVPALPTLSIGIAVESPSLVSADVLKLPVLSLVTTILTPVIVDNTVAVIPSLDIVCDLPLVTIIITPPTRIKLRALSIGIAILNPTIGVGIETSGIFGLRSSFQQDNILLHSTYDGNEKTLRTSYKADNVEL